MWTISGFLKCWIFRETKHVHNYRGMSYIADGHFFIMLWRILFTWLTNLRKNAHALSNDYCIYYWYFKDMLLLIKGSTEIKNFTDTFL